MKNLLLPFLILSSLNTFANEKGNGGGAHFCPARSSQEFYDIYEGQHRYGLTFDESATKSQVLRGAVSKLAVVNLSLSRKLRKQLDFIDAPGNFKLSSFELNRVPDADILMKDRGCEYRQLANWDDVTNKIFVDRKIYAALPEFHRSALLVHEALYKIARTELSMQNSNLTRQFVAELLSTAPVTIADEFFVQG